MQVVIKSTRRWAPKTDGSAAGYQEYDRCTCLQMIGRAGRPQYDLEGTAVIMTERSVRCWVQADGRYRFMCSTAPS